MLWPNKVCINQQNLLIFMAGSTHHRTQTPKDNTGDPPVPQIIANLVFLIQAIWGAISLYGHMHACVFKCAFMCVHKPERGQRTRLVDISQVPFTLIFFGNKVSDWPETC